MTARDFVFTTTGLVAALGLGVAAQRSTVELRLALRTAVAHAEGVSLEAVTIERASIGLEGLTIDGLSAGQVTVAHARFAPRWTTLLGGRIDGELHVSAVALEDPPLGAFDRVEVERADVTLGDTIRVHAHGVAAQLGPWSRGLPVHVGDVGIEVERHGLGMRRAAFTALSVGPLRDLAGGLHRRDGVVSVSAAGKGVHLAAQLLDDGLETTVTFDRFGLAFDEASLPILSAFGVPSGQLALTGTAQLTAPRGDEATPASLALDVETTGAVRVPRLAPRPISVDGVTASARGTLDGGTAHTTLRLARAGATLETAFDLDEDQSADDLGTIATVSAKLREVDCATLLAALPDALRPALDGMGLDGTIAGSVVSRVPVDAPDQLTLDGGLENHCKVLSEPPLADASRTTALRLPGAVDATGRPRAFELTRANPSWRSIDSVPKLVVTTFLDAEDAHFFHHAGVDLASIRSALSHDLESGTAGRGGSTITQQVAKNLFLSGERTIGRKLEEMVLAWRLEQRLGKLRILELYLNLAELGPGIYGLAEGSHAYFHKEPSELTADEAAQLAALLPAPRRGMDAAWKKRHDQLVARLPANLTAGLARQP